MNFLEIDFIESTDVSDNYKKKKKSGTVTDPILTPYEYARLLQCRAKQIAGGYAIKIEWTGPFDPIAIAECEIAQRVVPLEIIRKIPDSSKISGFRDEVWDLKDLDIRDC
jgi:DNA-directed RNA polymerase subunit K/omega